MITINRYLKLLEKTSLSDILVQATLGRGTFRICSRSPWVFRTLCSRKSCSWKALCTKIDVRKGFGHPRAGALGLRSSGKQRVAVDLRVNWLSTGRPQLVNCLLPSVMHLIWQHDDTFLRLQKCPGMYFPALELPLLSSVWV